MKTSIMAYASEIVDGKVVIAESSGDDACVTTDYKQAFDYLLENWDDDRERYPYHYIKACWCLDEFVAPILRLLPRPALEKIATTKKAVVGAYKVFYIPGKVFGVTAMQRIRGNLYEKVEANIYGIDQYFPGELKPKAATDIGERGAELLYNLERMGIYNPTKLTSPVSVFQQAVLDHMQIPTIYDMPEDGKGAANMALKLVDGEWRAVYKMGRFGELFDSDISAAYPHQVSLLPDTTKCQYIHSEIVPENYDWGLVSGTVTVDNPYTPVLYDDGEKDVPRVGSWKCVLTTELATWLFQHKAGKFEMKDGWFLKFQTNNRPFEVVANRVFNYRQGNELMDNIAKRIAVGISGKLGEEYEEGYGKLYNPIYRAMVLTRCKIMVADFIWKHNLQENVISVTVDGVLSDKYVRIASLKKMGQWRYSGSYPALILGTGMQWYGDKKPLGLTYEQVVEVMREHPKSGYFGVKGKYRVTLTEALKNGNLKSLGKMKEYEQTVDLLTLNPSVEFDGLPRTGEQALGKIYEAKLNEDMGI